MEYADKAMIDDRAAINSLKSENGVIVFDFIGYGKNDGMCCPTQKMAWRFKVEGNKLVSSDR
jgi:hypothetical protein